MAYSTQPFPKHLRAIRIPRPVNMVATDDEMIGASNAASKTPISPAGASNTTFRTEYSWRIEPHANHIVDDEDRQQQARRRQRIHPD